jgi:hypothetical protein
MSITAQELVDLQADAGLDANETVFTDEELERIWDRTSGASSSTLHHEAALALIFRQLLADANKFHDFKAGATEEKLSQIRANLKDQYEMYKPSLDNALERSSGFSIGVLASKPHQERTFPDEQYKTDNYLKRNRNDGTL